MARRIPRYEKIHEFEKAEGLPLSEPSAKTLRRKRRKQKLSVAIAFFVALSMIGSGIYGLYEWWRPGAPSPLPPLPGHVYPVRYEYGFFVVDKGYAYMKRIVCSYGGEENEPKVEPIQGGKELITCMLVEDEGKLMGAEEFSYPPSREYVLH